MLMRDLFAAANLLVNLDLVWHSCYFSQFQCFTLWCCAGGGTIQTLGTP